MRPIQIHLSEGDVAVLDAESNRTGASRSELIRRAIGAVYGDRGLAGTPAWVGIAADGSLDAERIDHELAEIFEERWRRWQ